MASYRELSERIEAFLRSNDQTYSDGLRDLAERYAEAMAEVNRQLRQCAEYLRSGLHAEAVHLAEQEPPLLERLDALEISAPNEWRTRCAEYELPVAEAPLVELAEALQEAYDEHAGSASLLDKHRRLALSRAPLSQRIAVLRQLTEANPQTPFWAEDLLEFERARFREMNDLARAATRHGDQTTLQAIKEELAGTPWSEDPPEELVKSVRAAFSKTTVAAAQEELKRVGPLLLKAEQKKDVAAGRAARTRWLSAIATARLPADHPYIQRVKGVLDWLAQVDEQERREKLYAQSIAELRALIDTGSKDLDEFRRLEGVIENLGYALPEELEERIDDHKAYLERSRRRAWLTKAAFGVAAVAAIVLVIGLAVYSSIQGDKQQQVVKEINSLLESEQLASARQIYDENRDLLTGEDGLAVRRELEAREGKERSRIAAFHAAVEAVEQAIDDPLTARSHLSTAEKYAKLDAEKLKLQGLSSAISRRERELATEKGSRFQQAFDGAAQALDRLEQAIDVGADGDTLQLRRDESRLALAALSDARLGVSAETGSRADTLTKRMSVLSDRADALAAQRMLLADLGNVVKGASRQVPSVFTKQYQTRLDNYLARFPNESRAADLKAVTQEVALWQAALEWQQVSRGWGSVQPRDEDEAAARLKAVTTFLTTVNPADSMGTAAREYGTYLKVFPARFKKGGPADILRSAFQSRLVHGPLYILQRKGGSHYRYYFFDKPDIGTLAVPKANYVNSFDGDVTFRVVENLESREAQPAPQVKMSNEVLVNLSATLPQRWRPNLLDVSQTVLAADKVDPLLRLDLLANIVLKQAVAADFSLDQSLDEVDRKLGGGNVDFSARWFDPLDNEADQNRIAAAKVLASVTAEELESAFQAADQMDMNLWQRLSEYRLAVAGVLIRNSGQWSCIPQVTVPADGELVVLIKARDGRAAWSPLESGDSRGTQAVTSADPGALREGRLVFVRQSTAPRQNVAGRQ